MAGFPAAAHRLIDELDKHRRIIWALLMREMSTRYGRDDLGFLWVLAEPLVFASAVAALWSVIRPPFEYGIRVIPFTITGYLPLILVRQTASFVVNSVKANQPLLYHRHITPLHLFFSRFSIEVIGITFAYMLIVVFLNFFGLMPLPKDLLVLMGGWALLAWLAFGVALIMGALAEMFEFVERFVQVLTYILIPLSGAFFMISALPPTYRHYVMMLPFVHCFELMRGAYFGPFLKTYYDVPYAITWAAGLTLIGLIVVQYVRERVEVEKGPFITTLARDYRLGDPCSPNHQITPTPRPTVCTHPRAQRR
ncbi:MAG: transporter, partial [Caulobacteraceae bacterium]|nr:transporter [Caulobacteraceae bacterium]